MTRIVVTSANGDGYGTLLYFPQTGSGSGHSARTAGSLIRAA
jgi:hypothetical protein